MFNEILGFLSSVGKDVANSKKINLSNRRIRSISSFSSNSIFYFPVVVSSQCQMDEVTMMQRALEKQYASFIVACISQIPFHRVSSSDVFAVDEYLKQFHQNLGVSPGSDVFAKAYNALSAAGVKLPIEESATFVPDVGSDTDIDNFFAKVWNESVEKNQDYVKYLVENYVSLNDVFNEAGTDPYTQVLTKRYKAVNEEMSVWGFVGAIPPKEITEMVDPVGVYDPQIEDEMIPTDPLDATAPQEDPEDRIVTTPITEGSIIDSVKFTLESVSDNKIRSCKNRSKLRSIESKLKGLKKKYTNYLIRYKKQYEENQKNGTDKKLVIRFNKQTIGDPKSFMKQYGSYIKIINRKLKLCEERRKQLIDRAAKGNVVTANESISTSVSYRDYLIDEAGFSKKDRNQLSDDQFGLPQERKYPLHDQKHVRLAIQMSGHVSDKGKRKELAGNICRRCKELDMDVTVAKTNPLYEYLPDDMKESCEENATTDLTHLDEDAIDSLIETIDNQLNAPNSEVFTLMEAADYEDLFDMYQKAQDEKRRADNLADALKRRQQQDRDDMQSGGSAQKDQEEPQASAAKADKTERTRTRSDQLRSRNSRGAVTAPFSDRDIFTKMDMQKCNEMVPTFTKATIGFIVDDTDEVVSRDILVGIKAYTHLVKTSDLVNEVYNAIISKRKFLKLVKFISGEENSLADLLFGIRELRDDALNSRKGGTKWSAAFKHRKRLSKMSVPFIMKNYLPNGTIVMTMNEVEYIKATYGVDVMRADHCRMIMDTNFLLGFAVLDQSNEIVHVMYHGINGGQFQQYSYAALEREQKSADRDMKEMFRLMNR